MDIGDSVLLKNRVSILSILFVLILYGAVAALSWGLALLLLVPCAMLGWHLSGQEMARAESTALAFKKVHPLKALGANYGEFQHVFYCERKIEPDLLARVIRELRKKTPVTSIEPLTITDLDHELRSHLRRPFLRADAGSTQWGTSITLVMQMGSFGNMQTVHWWVMGGGYVDRNLRFLHAAFTFLTLWFWIVPYLQKEHDLLQPMRKIYPGFFNNNDVTTRVRCVHDAVFEAMVDELDKNGIDTGDLRMQRAQVMNINIKGGKLSMGNIVQGAQNRVQSIERKGAHA